MKYSACFSLILCLVWCLALQAVDSNKGNTPMVIFGKINMSLQFLLHRQ